MTRATSADGALVSAADLRRIAGLPPNTFDRWVADHDVPAAVGGVRKGRTRRFGFMAALAVVAGIRLRQAQAPDAWTAGVVRFLARLPRAEFRRALAEGRTFPVPGAWIGGGWVPGMLVNPQVYYAPVDDLREPAETLTVFDEIDLARIAAEVGRAVAACGAGRPTWRRRGRT